MEEKGGLCPGSIYIDLVHIASGIICSDEELRKFCKELEKTLYDGKEEEFLVYISEDQLAINKLIKEARVYKVEGDWDADDNSYWYTNYEEIKEIEKRGKKMTIEITMEKTYRRAKEYEVTEEEYEMIKRTGRISDELYDDIERELTEEMEESDDCEIDYAVCGEESETLVDWD